MKMTTTIDSRRETVSLIGSDRLESTPVYGGDDRKIGTVQRVMIDKISGKVAYAVISFGGFLGMGEHYYPMPWTSLKYDNNIGGYRVAVTEDQLKGAPKYNRNTEWDWTDRNRNRDVYELPRAFMVCIACVLRNTPSLLTLAEHTARIGGHRLSPGRQLIPAVGAFHCLIRCAAFRERPLG
jgi:hypothetical protein